MDTILTIREAAQQVLSVDGVDGFLQIIPNVLTPEECQQIIREGEQKGFLPASLYTDKAGVEHFSELRKSYRCIIDSIPFAQMLWNRLEPFIPKRLSDGWEVKGINERLRLLRYTKGDEFLPHTDGTYQNAASHMSKITILIYLNTGYKGGFTNFKNNQGSWTAILPEVGMVAIQDQGLLHCVPPLEEGTKYVLRTEVMYGYPYDSASVKVVKIV